MVSFGTCALHAIAVPTVTLRSCMTSALKGAEGSDCSSAHAEFDAIADPCRESRRCPALPLSEDANINRHKLLACSCFDGLDFHRTTSRFRSAGTTCVSTSPNRAEGIQSLAHHAAMHPYLMEVRTGCVRSVHLSGKVAACCLYMRAEYFGTSKPGVVRTIVTRSDAACI